MKVLLSAYSCLPNAGSEPGIGWSWARHLAARGVQVTVLTRIELRDSLESYLSEHPVTGLAFAYVKVPTNLFPITGNLHYMLWQCYAVAVAKQLHQRNHFDVVHHVTYSSLHVPTQLWRLGIPTIFGPVGGGQTAPAAMLEYFGPSRWRERMRTLVTRAISYSPLHRYWLSRMNVILAANSDTLSIINRLGRLDASLQPDVGISSDHVETSARQVKSAHSPLRVIWVGSILPRKALPLALDALSRTTVPVELTIVGSGPPESVVRRMIAERNLNERVHWAARRLTIAEVRRAYLENDVMLFTSLRDTCGIQLVEAMAAGLIVVTLDHQGAREIVSDDLGIRVPVTTPSRVATDLAAAMDHLAAMDPVERIQMSRNSLKQAGELTWAKHAEDAVLLYNNVVMSSSPRGDRHEATY